MPKSNEDPSPCKICSVPTLISHYGVKSCEPCKVFFRRNVTNPEKTLKCDFGGQCQISINNRHICSACRFEKCLKVGMCPEMIRPPRGQKQTKTVGSITRRENGQPQRLHTLNLLERDQSLLSGEQWTLISNLVHSYDAHNALPIASNFMKELNSKPSKLRFKISSTEVMELVSTFYEETEPFIRSNQDFARLSANDRAVVMRGAADNVSCLGGGFLLRESGLITNLAFRHGLENTFGTIPFNLTLTAISLLDANIDLVKLTLSLFAFSTSTCVLFNENTPFVSITDYQTLLRIQNTYAELIWKYLLYKYSFAQAVKRFTQIIQCLVVALTIRTHLQVVQNHTDAIDLLIGRIEQHEQMNINDD